MSTAPERRALALIAAVASLGVGVRAWRSTRDHPAPTPAEVRALDAQIARIDSARGAGTAARAPRRGATARSTRTVTNPSAGEVQPTSRREPGRTTRTKGQPPPVDLDRATAAEIEALPWIGPAIAARVVASREKCGPFGSLQALTRVYGIGDATAKRLAPYVTFSAAPRPRGAATAPGCATAAERAAPRSRGRSK